VTSLGGTSADSPADVYSYVSVPLVSVTPTSGGPVTPVMVSGSGFRPAETVKVVYLTGLALPTSVVICKSAATAGGTFSCKGKVPGASSAGTAGVHTVKAKGLTSLRTATTTFTLT